MIRCIEVQIESQPHYCPFQFHFIAFYFISSANSVAEAMMDQADQFGWSVRPYQIQDIEELKRILHESTVKNILLFCEYEEVAMRVIREVCCMKHYR